MLSYLKSLNLLVVLGFLSISNISVRAQMEIKSQASAVFVLPALGYDYSAIEPYIDTETMTIHHSKHHKGYVAKLNAALENHRLKGQSIENILEYVQDNEEDRAVLNNAGGHYNHSLFWKIITPGGSNHPSGKLAEAIDKQFGSFEEFSAKFAKAASGIFGSGWAWLSFDKNNELFISTTSNQDNPLMKNVVMQLGQPILTIDVWEHAYYLKYQNKRPDYIENFMKVINWDVVSKKYESER